MTEPALHGAAGPGCGGSSRRRCGRVLARGHAVPRYWRSTTFSSVVEPTIYLLAFGFGFGSLVRVAGYDYIDFVGTGIVATAVLFSRVPRHVRHLHQAGLPEDLRRDARRAGRHGGARRRRGAVDRRQGGRLGCAPLLVAMAFGLTRPGGCCSSRSSARSPASASRFRHLGVRGRAVHRLVQLRHLRGADPAVPRRRHVLPDRRAARLGPPRRCSTRCTTASSWSGTPSSAWSRCRPGPRGALVVFAALMGFLAERKMRSRLID